ncbi:MAG: hypothetical protein AAAFM81_06020 [Pseudomonadota bacterium]
MKNVSSGLQIAASLLLVSAALHLLGAALSGFVDEGLILLPVVVLYVLLSRFLWRGVRPVAYVVFVFMLIGSLGSWIASGGVNEVPTWIYYAVSIVDLLCALVLFGVLWRPALPNSPVADQ